MSLDIFVNGLQCKLYKTQDWKSVQNVDFIEVTRTQYNHCGNINDQHRSNLDRALTRHSLFWRVQYLSLLTSLEKSGSEESHFSFFLFVLQSLNKTTRFWIVHVDAKILPK